MLVRNSIQMVRNTRDRSYNSGDHFGYSAKNPIKKNDFFTFMLAEELDSVEEGERIAGGALEIDTHINKQAKRNKKDRN